MTYKIIILIFFIILIFIINYNILEKLYIKEDFDVDFGKMNLILGESGVFVKDAEITPQNKIKFTLSNGNTLETRKSIKGEPGDTGKDAIYITGKQIKDGNLTFTFSDGSQKLIGKIIGESIAAGSTANPGDRGPRSGRIPKRFNKDGTENTEILDNGKIKLFLENNTYIESSESTQGNSGIFPDNVDPSSIAKITPETKKETDADYKARTCQLWYLENNNTKYLDIYKLFIGNSDSSEISNQTFDNIGDIIWNSEKKENFFDLKYENPKKLNGRFLDIINYIVLIDGNIYNLKRQIKIINFQRNELGGSIPKNLSNFINITSLQLQNNNLSGTIPAKLGDLVNLTKFNISSNNITGLIPNTFVNLTQLEKIDSERTGLIDKHQVKFDNFNNTQNFLKTLDILTYNGVKLGKGLLSLFRGLNVDYFNGTKSNDDIKSDLNLNKNLIELGLEISEYPLDMFRNKVFSWEDLKKESIIAIFSRIQMRYYYNNDNSNYFSLLRDASNNIEEALSPYMGAFRNMPIEGNIGSLFSMINEHGLNEKIKFINMSYNNLGGSIPDSITKLTNLTYLNLSHNQDISGQLPEIGQITNMKFLLLNNTGISGILPVSLKTLQNLVMINTKDTKLHYAYQKVKIPVSYSYQEITEYNDLSTQKAEIKEFLNTNISYDDYPACKTNITLCNNLINKKIELTDPTAEFVLVSDSDQVIVTNEDGTAVDGEWVQFPSDKSGFNEEDLGVLPANDEYGNIIPSTDTTFNELTPPAYKTHVGKGYPDNLSISYTDLPFTVTLQYYGTVDYGFYGYKYERDILLKITHKLNLSDFIPDKKFKLKKFKYSQFKDYDNIPIDITLNNLKFKYSSDYPDFSIEKASDESFERTENNLKNEIFTYKEFNINLNIKSNYKFKNIPESFFNKYYFKANKTNSVINLQSPLGNKIHLITDENSISKIKLNNNFINKVSEGTVEYNLGKSFKDKNQFTTDSGDKQVVEKWEKRKNIRYWSPPTSNNATKDMYIELTKSLRDQRESSGSKVPNLKNIPEAVDQNGNIISKIGREAINIQVEIHDKRDVISKLNNKGSDLKKTHNIYEI